MVDEKEGLDSVVGVLSGLAFRASLIRPVCGRPETRRVAAGRPGAGGGGLPLRARALAHACAGAGRRGRVRTRSLIMFCCWMNDRTNLNTNCCASKTGDEPVELPSEEGLVAPDVGLGGNGGPDGPPALFAREAAISRRALSSCSSQFGFPPAIARLGAPAATSPAPPAVKESTFPRSDHRFFPSDLVGGLSSVGNALVGESPRPLAKESKPMKRPG
jgi:hypothetical protein